MIPIRYHFLTVAALFLALGLGILLGGMAGQSWFAVKEQQLLAELEAKYDQALRSNGDLRKQVDRLVKQVEASHDEVIHLMAARFAPDLQGAKLYVWQGDSRQFAETVRVLTSAGITVIPYRPGRSEDEHPLLVCSAEQPAWADQLPASRKRMHLRRTPGTPEEKWKLLEDVQMMLREARREDERR